MSYVINGKIYTSYPLMDEIVYNCKLILNGIVVKNEYTAHLYESEESLYNQEILYKCKMGNMNFESMPYTVEMLLAFGYDEEVVNQYIADINLIPTEDRDSLVEFCMKYYIDNFVELNKYYRSLMGLPEYGTDRYNVYITESDLPNDFDVDSVDYSLPLHKQPSIVISALKSNGRLNEIIEENRSFNYSYLRFLDDLALDVYTCRKAGKWDILYIPDANALVTARFQEIYDINKYTYLRRTYQNAYAFKSDYYDHMLIFIVLCQTLTDMISDTPEWYIRKDIFDIRTVQFFLESYGIPFFDEIPIKYQIKIVKNLNKLIKYKSTQQNFEDIINIFKLRETHIYQYYLYKKRRKDASGQYIDDPDLNKMYELLFVETILGDTYDNYIKNLNYTTPYDTVTLADQYWDGTDDHEYVKEQILKKDFTIEPTKYLSLKADVNYIDYQRQIVYLMGLITDTRVDVEDITIPVSSIYEGQPFKISDLFIFLVLCNNLQYDLDQSIIRPQDVHEYKKYEIPDYNPEIIADERYTVPDWWNWDYGDEDDPNMYNTHLPKENFEGEDINDQRFEDETDSDPEANMFHCYNFGEYGTTEDNYGPDDYDYNNWKLGDSDWWLREKYPEFFINYEDRIFGFNPEANLEAITELLNREYTNFSLKNYTLADFGCDTYIVPTEDINTFERLLEIYENNMECYKKLNHILCHSCQDQYQQLIAKYIYVQLFTKQFDYNLGGTFDTLDQVLRSRDYILWSFYNNLATLADKESRTRDIQSILNEIILALEYYMDRDSLDYFFSFVDVSNFTSLIRYIYLMINIFKSYKAHFIEPTVRYQFLYPDMMAGNYTEMNDTIFNKLSVFSKFDKEYIHDVMFSRIFHIVEDYNNERTFEILDIFNQYSPDPDDDLDYDGGDPNTSDYIEDLNGTDVVMMIPYRTVDAGEAFAESEPYIAYKHDRILDYLDRDEISPILELNGWSSKIHSADEFFDPQFVTDKNLGTPTPYIVNKNFFKRLYDYQDREEMLVSARTGLRYFHNPDTNETGYRELWREWLPITEYESVKGDMDLLLKLKNKNEFIEYYQQFLHDLDYHLVKVFIDELYQKNNTPNGVNLYISNIWSEDNKRVLWDWDYGDEDDESSGYELLDIANYEDESLDEYDFEDINRRDEPVTVHHDYNFGDIDLDRILWIEDIYNYDTSRIISLEDNNI